MSARWLSKERCSIWDRTLRPLQRLVDAGTDLGGVHLGPVRRAPQLPAAAICQQVADTVRVAATLVELLGDSVGCRGRRVDDRRGRATALCATGFGFTCARRCVGFITWPGPC
jgi:uncharacterized membrane protein YccC